MKDWFTCLEIETIRKTDMEAQATIVRWVPLIMFGAWYYFHREVDRVLR